MVPKLLKSCIIGIDLLDEFRSYIDLDNKTISFPHLEGKPPAKIMNEERAQPERDFSRVNAIQREEDGIEIKKEDIKLKIGEIDSTDREKMEELEAILRRHKAVFGTEPGRLWSYQHVLNIKEDQPFIGQSCPIPLAYREKVNEEINKILSSSLADLAVHTPTQSCQ